MINGLRRPSVSGASGRRAVPYWRLQTPSFYSHLLTPGPATLRGPPLSLVAHFLPPNPPWRFSGASRRRDAAQPSRSISANPSEGRLIGSWPDLVSKIDPGWTLRDCFVGVRSGEWGFQFDGENCAVGCSMVDDWMCAIYVWKLYVIKSKFEVI